MFGNIFGYMLEKQAEEYEGTTRQLNRRLKNSRVGAGASTNDRVSGGGIGIGNTGSTGWGLAPGRGGFAGIPKPLESGAYRHGPNNNRYVTTDTTNPEQFYRGTSSSVTIPRNMAVDLGVATRVQPGESPGGGLGIGTRGSTSWGSPYGGGGFAPIGGPATYGAYRMHPKTDIVTEMTNLEDLDKGRTRSIGIRPGNIANNIDIRNIPKLTNEGIESAINSTKNYLKSTQQGLQNTGPKILSRVSDSIANMKNNFSIR